MVEIFTNILKIMTNTNLTIKHTTFVAVRIARFITNFILVTWIQNETSLTMLFWQNKNFFVKAIEEIKSMWIIVTLQSFTPLYQKLYWFYYLLLLVEIMHSFSWQRLSLLVTDIYLSNGKSSLENIWHTFNIFQRPTLLS